MSKKNIQAYLRNHSGISQRPFSHCLKTHSGISQKPFNLQETIVLSFKYHSVISQISLCYMSKITLLSFQYHPVFYQRHSAAKYLSDNAHLSLIDDSFILQRLFYHTWEAIQKLIKGYLIFSILPAVFQSQPSCLSGPISLSFWTHFFFFQGQFLYFSRPISLSFRNRFFIIHKGFPLSIRDHYFIFYI